MNGLFMFIIGLYVVAFIVSIIIISLKIRERIKEKPQDDNDLNRFDKY